METKILKSLDTLGFAAEALRKGGMVGVPTETVYGLCVNGLDPDAVAALYEIKGRPEVKPLSLMVAGSSAIDEYCLDVPRAAYTLADAFWPGPLTIVLRADTALIPAIVRAGGETVGLRCPDHPLTLALLKKAALPLAGPSANPSGQPSPKTAEDVLGYFNGRIDAVIDGGACGFGRESTIIDLSRTPYRILRQGALPREDISAVLTKGVRVIGLTGGTGCGKSTALAVLKERGALALDCDAIYHELLDTSDAMLSELREHFPAAFADGTLDRRTLGTTVFSDADALEALNAITHRYVKAEVTRRLEEFAWNGGTLAVIDAIALTESGLGSLCEFTVAVTAPEEQRLARIMARDGIEREYAKARIAAQKENASFVSRCTYELKNEKSEQDFINNCAAFFDSHL